MSRSGIGCASPASFNCGGSRILAAVLGGIIAWAAPQPGGTEGKEIRWLCNVVSGTGCKCTEGGTGSGCTEGAEPPKGGLCTGLLGAAGTRAG